MRSHLGQAIEDAGGATAGILLYRIRGKIRAINCAERDGWFAHSYAQWIEDTSLTSEQIRGALDRLVELGLIEKRQGLFGNRNVLQVRLVTIVEYGLQPGLLKEGGTYLDKDDKKGGEDALPEDPRTGKGSVPVKMGKTVADVMAAAQKKSVEPPKVHASYGQFWRETVGQHHKHFQPALTAQQLGQLNQVKAKAPPGQGKAILARVIEHWPSFVKETGWAKSGPTLPDVGFVVKHLVVACNFMLEEPAKPATKKLPTTLTIKPAPTEALPQPQHEPKATLDDILAPPTSPIPKGKGP